VKNETPFPTIEFLVPADRQYNGCHVYKPKDIYAGVSPRYIVPAFLIQLPSGLVRGLIAKHGIHQAKSIRAPEVIYRDMDRLVVELRRLDARNLPRDKVFEGRELKVRAHIMPLPTGREHMEFIMERWPDATSHLAPLSVTILGDL
jgi:hypothetical protein